MDGRCDAALGGGGVVMAESEGGGESKFLTGFLLGFLVGVVVALGVGASLVMVTSRRSEMMAARERAELEAERARAEEAALKPRRPLKDEAAEKRKAAEGKEEVLGEPIVEAAEEDKEKLAIQGIRR